MDESVAEQGGFLREAIEQAPMGYAYHEVILDDYGNPIDYVFLDVNSSFEEMTGLTGERIIGERATEVLPGLESGEFNWVQEYGEVALTGKGKEFQQYSKPLDRWYNVKAYSPQKKYFVTYFTDITEEMKVARSSQELLQGTPGEINHNRIVQRVRSIAGGVFASFDVRDSKTGKITTVATSAADELSQVLGSAEDLSPVGRTWDPDSDCEERISAATISVFNGLDELAGRTLPAKLCEAMKECIEAGNTAVIKVAREGEMIGRFTVVMPPGVSLENRGLVKVYSQQVASFLARVRAERELREQEKHHRIISDLSSDYFYSLEVLPSGKLNVDWISGSFERVTSYPPEEIRNFDQWLTHFHSDDVPMTEGELARLMNNNPVKTKYRIITKAGGVRWFRDRLRPEWSEREERVVRVYGAVRDITERVEAEKEIQELSEQQRICLDNIDVQIWYLTDEETYGKINEAHANFLGVDKDEAEGKTVFDMFDAEEARSCIEGNKKVFRDKEKLTREVWLENADGVPRLLALSQAPKLDENGGVSSLISAARDITEFRRKKNLRKLINIFSNELIGVKEDKLDLTIDGMLEEVGEFVDADRVYLFQFSDDGETMDNTHEWCNEGIEPEKENLQNLPSDIFPWWIEKLRDHENILIPLVSELPPRAEEEKKILESQGIQSVLVVPVYKGNRLLGFVGFDQVKKQRDWSHELASLLRIFATAIGNALARKREEKLESNIQQLEDTIAGITQALSATVELRDSYTAGHQRNVADISLAIADKLGTSADMKRDIKTAAMLHDIGKISTPPAILNETGELGENEFEIIRRHPKDGYEILSDINFPGPVPEIVYQHHERLDGSGYPRGLEGDDILKEARAIAVVDAFEAMTSHRPYRPALSVEEAIEELDKEQNKGPGVKYDPEVLAALKELIAEEKLTEKVEVNEGQSGS